MSGTARAGLAALEQRTLAPVDDVLALFDALPAVAVAEMHGRWTGRALRTGHPLDGLLAAAGWHGKRFAGSEAADPLVMNGPRRRYALNPAAVPLGMVVRLSRPLQRPAVGRLLRSALPLLSTRRPAARLRPVEHRGVVTATMIYDAVPVHDHFRRIDPDTVLGCMDLRGLGAPFLFVLEREAAEAAPPLFT